MLFLILILTVPKNNSIKFVEVCLYRVYNILLATATF